MERANAAFVKALQELVEKDRARDKRLGELEENEKIQENKLLNLEKENKDLKADRTSDKQRSTNLEAKLEKRARRRKRILSRMFKIIFYEKWKYLFYPVDSEFHQIDHQLFSQYFSSIWKAFRKENILWLNSEKTKNKNSCLNSYLNKYSCQSNFCSRQ